MSCQRLRTPSFWWMFVMWFLTVWTEMKSARSIWVLLRPRRMSEMTSASLGVRPRVRQKLSKAARSSVDAAGAAVLDYLEGLLSGDVTRLEKALHPETNQVVFLMAGENGAAILNRIRYSGLLESAKAKLDPPPEGARKAEVRVLDLMDGMAFAAAQAGIGEAYLQLQLLDGQWKAINVLLRPTRNLLQLPPRKK
jgi:lysophospholipase L1-like esterase